MSWWEQRVVPRLTDRALAAGQVMKRRGLVCEGLHGRVLEIGFGSGLNLEKIPPGVIALDAVEPSDAGWSLSAARRAAHDVPVTRVGLDGERLDAADAAYDAVLCTFTLCTIPDPVRALDEVRRVLRPGGALHFLEHGRSPHEAVQTWQRRLEPAQRRLFAGCHLTRQPAGLARAAGLQVEVQQEGYLPGPVCGRPWAWTTLGRAVSPGPAA